LKQTSFSYYMLIFDRSFLWQLYDVVIRSVSETRTDRRTWLNRLSSSFWSTIYIPYGVCHASFNALQTL